MKENQNRAFLPPPETNQKFKWTCTITKVGESETINLYFFSHKNISTSRWRKSHKCKGKLGNYFAQIIRWPAGKYCCTTLIYKNITCSINKSWVRNTINSLFKFWRAAILAELTWSLNDRRYFMFIVVKDHKPNGINFTVFFFIYRRISSNINS